MTLDEKIAKLWGHYSFKTDYSGYVMDDEDTKEAMKALAQWQKERCVGVWESFGERTDVEFSDMTLNEFEAKLYHAILHAGESDE